MLQLDLFADFLNTAWEGSKIDVRAIEQHPNMKSLQLVAYQEWLDWSGSGEPQGLFLIIEGAGKHPYHLGGDAGILGHPDYVVNPNCIEQQFMLSHPDRWRLKPWRGKEDVQWTPWVWKDSDAERRFMDWHSKWFSSWTKEAWEDAKKRGLSWRPSKEGQE